MRKPHFGCREQQALAAKQFMEQAVVPPLAVGGVADDGVGDVLHVAAQLVPAAGQRLQFDQGIAAAGVAVHAVGQFHGGQPAVAGVRGLGGIAGGDAGMFVGHARQGVVDVARFRRVAAHDGEVAFADFAAFELLGEHAADFTIQRKQQHAGSAFVEPVHRIYLTADLVAQDLQRETGFVAIEHAAMHQQPGRFVNGDEAVVAVNDR